MKSFYKTILNKKLKITFLIFLSFFIFFAYNSKDFKLDASSDTLILENDKDLLKYREITKIYSTNDFLITTITSNDRFLKKENIRVLEKFLDEVGKLNWVDSVQSILDAPLLSVNNQTLSDLVNEIKTLKSDNINLFDAENELVNSPLFKELIISKDAKTTGILINFKKNKNLENIVELRDQLQNETKLTKIEKQRKLELDSAYEIEKKINDVNRHNQIVELRKIIEKFKSQYNLDFHLGGVAMIADDTISFVKNDIVIFGSAALIFILIVLYIIFRQITWMIVCISNCIFVLISMTGLLSILQWKVTVISSNFIMLVLILSLSMTVHIVVRYKQILIEGSFKNEYEVIIECINKMFKPCLYSALTTIFAFATLYTSGIRPVMDFGLMMSLGLICTYLSSFLFLPNLISLFNLSKNNDDFRSANKSLLLSILDHRLKIITIFLSLLILGMYGTTKLKVENSFINYFKKSTEIYQGMKLIDDQLGGTTPFDIIINFGNTNEDAIDDDFLDFGIEYNPADYWFTEEKINLIKDIHDDIENNQYTGKVLSLASIVRVAENINNGQEFDALELAVLYKNLPIELKDQILSPFVSINNNQARISVRLIDSNENLNRGEFVSDLEALIQEKYENKNFDVSIVGVLILYNNMLQSLFDSQIKSLAIVMIGIFFMLLYLFKSIKIALITITPNIVACFTILGIMGYLNISLDLMTITIAAITIGIAVDNSIHYVFRYLEYRNTLNSRSAVERCGFTVAKAIRNTSVTIIAGFSILIFSNFYPTIYFGIFTAIAMLIALLGCLTLLPVLLNYFDTDK